MFNLWINSIPQENGLSIQLLEALECSSLRHLILCVSMCVFWARLWWITLMKCAQCFLSITPHRFPSLCVLCPFYWLSFILFSFHTASEMKRCKLFFLLIKRMKAGICLALLIALDWKWIEWHRFGNSWIIFPHKITSGIRVQRDQFQLSPRLIYFFYASAMFVLSPLVRETYQNKCLSNKNVQWESHISSLTLFVWVQINIYTKVNRNMFY